MAAEKQTPIDDGPPFDPEVVEESPASAIVRSGAAVVRIENETLMRVSIERPRDLKAITEEAMCEIQAFPEEADTLYYAIPFENKRTGKKEWVRGPSVGMSRSLMRLYGNVDVKSRIVEQAEDYAKVEGIAVDMQKVVRFSSELSCTRIQKKRGGGTYLLDIDKWQKLIAATAAKAERNAALKILPRPLVMKCFELAMQLSETQGKDAKAVSRMVAAFAALKPAIGEDVLAYFAGVATVAEITPEGYAHLRGLYNALRKGETQGEQILAQYEDWKKGNIEHADELSGSTEPQAEGTIGEEPRPPAP